ncbi:hypothetical protein PN462_07815 [Spirulina sp. CS-785/01]|uniref:hypothetical protein n=1 Tax=Spirulina sp. CS-785/01 TaxID=3021716 RepID=UPI00232EC4D1|nr:hypothetical protein [Spirulina sp. CS-785/01]MDB9313004.1 hypothetical protein [Spirulina sp. CS-785/01]
MAELNRKEMRERLGNVEQIREILFGTQLRTYEERFEEAENELETLGTNFEQLQQEVRDRLDAMEHSLTTLERSLNGEVQGMADALEKKLKYLSLTTHEENTKLWQRIEQFQQKYSTTLDTFNKNLNNKTHALREELTETQETFQTETQTLKTRIFEELEKCFSNLRESKVSRADLAEVLFELCIKVKGTEFVPDLREAMESRLQAEFLLPDNEEENQDEEDDSDSPESNSASGIMKE